ncbi:MAG: outer-membrane lipoprotein carrier protein LolA [Spirochaetales bacterium]|nr:outer-membrane lipoprotein carrier protein LolA [Spirochaetales bacterium]
MKKLFLSIILSAVFTVSAQEASVIPFPKNGQLYTEYTSRKSSPYIKKVIESTGWIAKDGDKFAFFQETPSVLKVVNKGDEMSLKIGNNKPMKMKITADSATEYSDIGLLFTDDAAQIDRTFSISSEKIGSKTRYFLKPKGDNKVIGKLEFMRFVSTQDKLEKLEIKYKNGTAIEFTFFNTVTGEDVDEKKFD